jgi:hypothetical protein
MRWRLGLVIATMAIALAGQAVAVILVAPDNAPRAPHAMERAQPPGRSPDRRP